MHKIRKRCFETNSSSTHAFVLDTDSEATTYTDAHLEAFTEHIFPYSKDEVLEWSDSVILSDLKDKVRYMWTVYLYHCNCFEGSRALELMSRLQQLLPQAVFCIQFSHGEAHSKWDVLPYLEDSDYVMTDYYAQDMTAWSDETLKQFLCEGVIIFGDRDRLDICGDSIIDTIIDQVRYKKILVVSG